MLKLFSHTKRVLQALLIVAVMSNPVAAQTAAPAKPEIKTQPAKPATKNLSVMEVAVDKGVPITTSAPAASVFIANPDVADVQLMSPTSVMVYGKKTGQTTLMVTDNNGNTLIHRTIVVRQNLDDLRTALRVVLPDNKIGVESVPNGIVLTGEAKDAGAVEDARKLALRYVPKDGGEVINRIKVRGNNQIHIRVRFAEVSRDVDKRFGINWESIGSLGDFALGLASGSALIPTASDAVPHATGGDIGSSVLNRVRPNSGSNNITTFSTQTSKYNINGMIDALAEDGFITILAEPNLTAMSGETASFLAGGEFPIPVPQQQNITIEWKTFGVSLAFTPTLIGESRINLHVRPEVSQLSDAGAITLNSISIPALTTRRAETTIELASGQSFAIGGLLNNNQNQSVNKYPFLGDMPVIGALFKSTRFQNNQSELVIIITPYIVKPSQEEHLALPMDGYAPPSDLDRILFNRTTNSDPAARPVSGAPRAVLEPSPYGEPPAPSAAPLQPVSAIKNDMNVEEPKMSLPVVTPVPVARPKQVSRAVPANPAGPSGFIVE